MTAPTGAAHPTLGSRRKIGVTAIVDPRADSEVDLIETVVRALGDAGLVFLDYRATHSVPLGAHPRRGRSYISTSRSVVPSWTGFGR
jgi:hypothetical protein